MRKLLTAFLVFSMPAWALDVAGRWWGETVTGGSTQRIYITFIQEGNSIRGSAGPTPTDQALMTNGKIEGRRVTFDILPGGQQPVHFDLSADGEWLKGTVKVQHNGQTMTGTISIRRRTT